MTTESEISEAIVAELKRQASNKETGLRVDTADPGNLLIEGRVNLDELVMAILGSLAGGP